MRLAGVYSFNGGEDFITKRYPTLLVEINDTIKAVDASQLKTKESEESKMVGRMLYDPSKLNKGFKAEFSQRGWRSVRVKCDYPTSYYTADYKVRQKLRGAFREMDFVKEQLGIEVQFGKYSFMVYNVCAKMTIFHKRGFIDSGVEIVPVKTLAKEMSSGVSYFEQFVWDLEERGVSDIDIPVLILGIDA